MPQFTLSEMMSLATTRAGRRADLPASDVSRYVNIAYLTVADEAPSALMELRTNSSITSGTFRYTLPAAFGEPIAFQLRVPSSATTGDRTPSFKTLTWISQADLMASDRSARGEPKEIAFFAEEFEVVPSPNSDFSLELRYRSMVSDLTATTQIPSLSTPWRWAVVLKAEELIRQDLGDFAGAVFAGQTYLNYVSSRKNDEARRQSGQFRFFVTPVYRGGA